MFLLENVGIIPKMGPLEPCRGAGRQTQQAQSPPLPPISHPHLGCLNPAIFPSLLPFTF